MKKIAIIIFVILTFGVSIAFAETYEEWISTCKDYKDVAKWMKKNFLYDNSKLKDCLGRKGTLCEVYSPEITFNKKSGVCFDAAVFAKWSLNRINPDYKAELINLYPGTYPDHYVTGFYVDGKLFVLDYGLPFGRNQSGTWGPFENLDNYVKDVYFRWSGHRQLKKYCFGWPTHRSSEPW
jgi:hypothetical protein